MSHLEEMRDQFASRLDQQREAHDRRAQDALHNQGWNPAALPQPEIPAQTTDHAQLTRYEDWLDGRIHRWRNEFTPVNGIPVRGAGTDAPTDRRSLSAVAETVDRLLLDNFELRPLLKTASAIYRPLHVCRDQGDFLTKASDGLGLTGPERAAFVDRLPAGRPPVQVIYVPGLGCLAHTERDEPGSSREMVRAVVRAKWGWGFILEHTALGQGMLSGGLYTAWLARELGVVNHSTRWRENLERLKALEGSYSLALQAWQEWLWGYLSGYRRLDAEDSADDDDNSMDSMAQKLGVARELLVRVLHLDKFGVGDVVLQVMDIHDLLNFISLSILHAPEQFDEFLRATESELSSSKNEQWRKTAETLRLWLGQRYMKVLEANVSTYCIPHAVRIAFYVPENLAKRQPSEIRANLAARPAWNVNKRLAMLTRLDPAVRYDPHALRLATRERLKLDTPEE